MIDADQRAARKFAAGLYIVSGLAIGLLLLWSHGCLLGCVAPNQTADLRPPGGGGEPPVDFPMPPPPHIQQASGQIATTADVSGWTGLELHQALPLGLIPLLGWIVWLSHRREGWRIRGRE